MRIRTRVALAMAAGMAATMVISQIASASHPRPLVAGSMRVSLVPTFNQCAAAPNRTHGPPLDSPSCNPPVQSSSSLTIGTPDANGAPANSVNSVRVATIEGAPGPPEDSDVRLVANLTDVRCRAGTTACGSGNAAGGADYTGELQAGAIMRITDHFNAVSAGGGTDAATVVDLALPFNLACTATGDTSIGGACSVNTTIDAVIPPDAARDGKRAVMQIKQLLVWDGGTDGLMSTSPNALFAVQGLFIP